MKKAFVFIIILTLLGAAGGGGIYYYLNFVKDKGPVENLSHVKLKPEIIEFTYRMLPGIYSGIVGINGEISIIDQEMARLAKMEKDFPKERQIILAEKNLWKNQSSNLFNTLSKIEDMVETLYVSFSVNPENGLDLIKEKQNEIQSIWQDSLTESQKMTARLKPAEPKNLIDKIKRKFLK